MCPCGSVCAVSGVLGVKWQVFGVSDAEWQRLR